jgi:hypothetical protein
MPITVYAAKVDGSNYDTVPMNAKGSGAGGNGGAAARVKQTSKLDPVGVSRYNTDVFGSTVIDGNNTDKALSAGEFAHNHIKPIGPRQTSEIAGQANDFLLSGANVPDQIQSIHFMKICGMGCYQGIRTRKFTTAIRENHYNRFTGQWDAGYPQQSNDYFNGIDNSSGDNAATPTRGVPGELTYKSAGLVPVNDVYKPKNG